MREMGVGLKQEELNTIIKEIERLIEIENETYQGYGDSNNLLEEDGVIPESETLDKFDKWEKEFQSICEKLNSQVMRTQDGLEELLHNCINMVSTEFNELIYEQLYLGDYGFDNTIAKELDDLLALFKMLGENYENTKVHR